MPGGATDVNIGSCHAGTAHASLHFNIRKGQKDYPVPRKRMGYNFFVISWPADVLVDGKPMVKDKQSGAVIVEAPLAAAVLAECPAGEKHNWHHLMTLTLLSEIFDGAKISAKEEKS